MKEENGVYEIPLGCNEDGTLKISVRGKELGIVTEQERGGEKKQSCYLTIHPRHVEQMKVVRAMISRYIAANKGTKVD